MGVAYTHTYADDVLANPYADVLPKGAIIDAYYVLAHHKQSSFFAAAQKSAFL
jgi:uncharacterized membrane protein